MANTYAWQRRPTIRYFTPICKVANLVQNCYFCLIQKTISNSILWSLVIKCFWPGCFGPLTCCARGQLPPLPLPPLLRHWFGRDRWKSPQISSPQRFTIWCTLLRCSDTIQVNSGVLFDARFHHLDLCKTVCVWGGVRGTWNLLILAILRE